jgi:hypothetical protein
MEKSVVTFSFEAAVPMEDVRATLRLALLAAECLHGEDRVRLEAHVSIDPAQHTCSIETGFEVGRTLAILFGGYIRREFGDSAVTFQSSNPTVDASTTPIDVTVAQVPNHQ